MTGCDFNPRWFWTNENIKAVLKLLPELDKPVFHICSGVSWIGDYRLDRSIISSDSLNDRDNRRGKIVFIAPWIPNNRNITVLSTDLWNVGSNGAYHKIRTMFYKSNAQLEDY